MNSAPTPGVKNACGIFLYLENVDATFNRAVAAGASVEMPLADQFWGDRYGKITDPFGHNWGLAQHVEDRKSTRLNSSHVSISYAVFCLKKKKKIPTYSEIV